MSEAGFTTMAGPMGKAHTNAYNRAAVTCDVILASAAGRKRVDVKY